MTTIKDPIRQASLFTMSGLVDPRLMNLDAKETPAKSQAVNHNSSTVQSGLRKIWEELTGISIAKKQTQF